MKKTTCSAGKIAIALCSALLSYTAYGQPTIEVTAPSVHVALPSIEIRAESDFYEPLAPQGEWVVVGSYGRCWRPAHVARDWRPYCNGNWERTDAGWYWVSDEPWAWATYHYGRWDYTDDFGWYWVPQVQWAPAWVSWHEGGGYIGWAPLQPRVSISVHGYVGFNQSRLPSRAYVFVQPGRFLEPVRSTTVVVNTTTIINKTVIISNTKIVNNTVINGGPATAVIEKASGRRVHPVAVHELRQREEAPVAKRGFGASGGKTKSDSNRGEARSGVTHPATTKEQDGSRGDTRLEKQSKPVKQQRQPAHEQQRAHEQPAASERQESKHGSEKEHGRNP
ncbi:MAG: hypothetical protein JWO95_627 [Verrucomicrobiales bacterium]|nr:hypothetical protein [Verrucomicrobiales bacterium]